MIRISRNDLRQHLARLRRLKTWQLLIVLLISVVITASLLRLNNLAMDTRRKAVIAADQKGDKPAVKKSLIALQEYVSGHMNTSLSSGLYLEKQYERDREAALAAASTSTNPNAAVYQQASIECRARWQGGVESFRNDYVQCVAERVKSLGAGSDAALALKLPRADNYHYNFVSPKWSPDLAGIFVVWCLFITSVITLRGLTYIILRGLIKSRFKSV